MLTPRLDTHGAATLLLSALADPSSVRTMTEEDWDVLVRVARTSKLLGTLDARVATSDAAELVPPAVSGQLRSERAAAAYRTKMVWWELERLAGALGPLGVPVVLLKGAAYLAQGLRCAAGRTLSDVDVLVPRERLAEVERALLAHGWGAQELEPYDDRYYRRWSHELPPFRYEGSALELDVHHALLPPLGRIPLDSAVLLERSVATGALPFRVLAPADQTLHAALHLFQDSDCTNRLRELVDLDGLVRDFSTRPGFWKALLESAVTQRAGRPLWYAMRFAGRLVGTPMPKDVAVRLRACAPPPVLRSLMDTLIGLAVMPPDPDRGYPRGASIASSLLLMRSVWLRFPPRVFLLHSLAKALPWLRNRAGRPQAM